MSNGSEEERRRRKIIIDSQVAAAAMAGIAALGRGELSPAQVDALIELDQEYLDRADGIAPGLVK